MKNTPHFPIRLLVPLLLCFLIAGCGQGFQSATNEPPTLLSIAFSPASRSIPLGGTRQFTITGNYSDGNQSTPAANSVNWKSSDPASTITPGGYLTVSQAFTIGNTLTITASYGGMTASLPLTVTPTDIFGIWSANIKPFAPAAIAIDSSNNVYVANAIFSNNSSMILKYNASGTQTASFKVSISNNAAGIAADSSGNVYVTDYNKNSQQINVYNSTGALTGTLPTTVPPGFAPAGVAVDSAGKIYVTDAGDNYLYEYDSSYALVKQWSTTGIPSGVAVDPSGNVYVADFSNQMIRVYNANGISLTSWSVPGIPSNLPFGPPSGVAVYTDSSTGITKIYVVDTYNYLLREYDFNGISGTQKGFWSTTGWPSGVAVDSAGKVYVVDATNNVIRKCSPQ